MRALICLLLSFFFLSNPASAVLPAISSATPANPVFTATPNTMMFDVAVVVSAAVNDTDHDGRVGYIPTATFNAQGGAPNCGTMSGWTNSPVQRFGSGTSLTYRLWNFTPTTPYTYRVDIGPTPGTGADVYQCGTLGTPTLPSNLGFVNFRFDTNGTPSSTYIVMEAGDCSTNSKDYIVIFNVALQKIVWYLDPTATVGIAGGSIEGMRYMPGASSNTGHLLVIIDRRWLYDMDFGGNYLISPIDFNSATACTGATNSAGPCIHHDAYKSDTSGNYYAVQTRMTTQDTVGTDWEFKCGVGAFFLNDGWMVSPGLTEKSLMTTYGLDPRVYGGPDTYDLLTRTNPCIANTFGNTFNTAVGQIEWTHANAVTTDNFGGTELMVLGYKELDRIIRINPATPNSIVWTLSGHPADSDLTLSTSGITGPATFADQHDPHFVSLNELMFFDNTGDPRGSRGLRVTINTGSGTATINKAWQALDRTGANMSCSIEGVAEEVPGTSGNRIMMSCRDTKTVLEASNSVGATGTAPPLDISIGTPICNGGTFTFTSQDSFKGWHRAFPILNLGSY